MSGWVKGFRVWRCGLGDSGTGVVRVRGPGALRVWDSETLCFGFRVVALQRDYFAPSSEEGPSWFQEC